MTKIKLGDTVRIIGNHNRGCNLIGDIGIITEINDVSLSVVSVRVKVEGKSSTGNWYILTDLEVISKEECSEYISPLNSYYYI